MNHHYLFQTLTVLVGASVCHGDDLASFSSPLAESLKPGITAEQVKAISDPALRQAAELMLAGKYSTEYRVAEYQPLLSPRALGRALGIGDGYSNYEGVTGIVLNKGENTIIVEGLKPAQSITVLVPDWLRQPPNVKDPTKDPKGWSLHKKTYTLANGINKINVEKEGLAYVSYYFDKPEAEKPIKIHFVNATENGYFDISKHDDTDWDRLLADAKYPIMDALGERIQVSYPVESFKKYTAGRGVELINAYDKMMKAQHDLMGLTKYKRVPKNRILSRVNYNYYMFRDGDGVAYMGGPSGYAMGLVANPDRVSKGDPCWGFNHEVGHAHQLRPEFNWGGLGEVSNNVFSLYGTMAMGNPSLLKQNKQYAKARAAIIGKGISYLQHNDVFSRLVPFWQLQLYFTKNGNPDFYPDLFEALRLQQKGGVDGGWGSRKGNPAEYQLNFIKQACKAGKTDLTDFFDKWGYFYVGEFEIGDYGKYQYKMTQQMVDDCKKAIADMKLPKPKVDMTTLED